MTKDALAKLGTTGAVIGALVYVIRELVGLLRGMDAQVDFLIRLVDTQCK